MVSTFSGYGWNFSLILYLVITIIGMVANLCVLVLLIKEKGKKTSVTMYLIAMTIDDILSLLIFLVFYWLYLFKGVEVEHSSIFACKIPTALDFTIDIIGIWLVVALVGERLIYLYFPRMTKLFSRRLTGIFAIVMIVGIALLLNGHYILWMKIKEIQPYHDDRTISVCSADTLEYREYIELFRKYIVFVFAGICPSLCIIFGNVLFVKALYQSFTTPMTNGRMRLDGRTRDILIYTMMISILFLFLEMPRTVAVPFDLMKFGRMIVLALYLLNRTLKPFVYVLYTRSFRVRCIKI